MSPSYRSLISKISHYVGWFGFAKAVKFVQSRNSLLTILQTAVFLCGIFDLILDMTSVCIFRFPDVSMR